MRRLHLASASERRLAWLKDRLDEVELSAAPLIIEEPKPRWGAPVNEQVEFTCTTKAKAAAREGVVSQMAGKQVAEVVIVSPEIVSIKTRLANNNSRSSARKNNRVPARVNNGTGVQIIQSTPSPARSFQPVQQTTDTKN